MSQLTQVYDNEIGHRKYICQTCGYIYDEASGDSIAGIAPHTPFEDIPDDWICSLCGDSKSEFTLLNKNDSVLTSTGLNSRENISRNNQHNIIVIIGAGFAGWKTIEAIRNSDQKTPFFLSQKPALIGIISQTYPFHSLKGTLPMI